MRILWQSFLDPRVQHAYAGRLSAELARVAGPGVDYALRGLDPPDRHLHRITETRCGAQAVANALRAEDEGFEAIVVGHFQDPGLWEVRAAVDVPVIGLGECSMLHACQLGRRVGLVTISPVFLHWHEEQIVRYRLEDRVTGVRAMDTSVDLYLRAFEDDDAYREVRRQFVEHAAPLAAAGVEVVIPAGGLPGLLLGRERGLAVDGAAVLNPLPVAAAAAETAVRLRAEHGTTTSRHSTFALPSAEARREYLEQIG